MAKYHITTRINGDDVEFLCARRAASVRGVSSAPRARSTVWAVPPSAVMPTGHLREVVGVERLVLL